MAKTKNYLIVLLAVAILAVGIIAMFFVGSFVVGKIQDLTNKRTDDDQDENETVNEPPVAMLRAYNDTVEVGYAAVFDGNGSYDPDYTGNDTVNRGIITYQWVFSDGSDQTTVNATVQHAFMQPGTFNVTLTVYDEDSASDKKTISIRVVYSDEFFNTNQVLLADPFIPGLSLVGNYSEYSWEVKKDATEVDVNVSFIGYNVREFGPYKVQVWFLDGDGEVIDNRTLTAAGSSYAYWNLRGDEVPSTGDYLLQVQCESGATYITIEGFVSYT